MTDKRYDLVVFIGRFQPFHNAHLETIKKALEISKKVLVLIGSSRQPRTIKNPFSFHERKYMIFNSLGLPEWEPNSKVVVEDLVDCLYNEDEWLIQVQDKVAEYTDYDSKNVAIIGFEKDQSSEYLNFFPQWDRIQTKFDNNIDATQIREMFFSTKQPVNLSWFEGVVPPAVLQFLKEFTTRHPDSYKQLIQEKEFIDKYKKQFEVLPYDPVFVTVDAVVFCLGHVLLIKRKSEPGRGLWALPGGFLNAKTDKSVLDGAIRELKEETKIDVPVPVLKGSIEDNCVFDAIGRSLRGRTITHAFKINLKNEKKLPKIKASDDAEDAIWMPLSEFIYESFFEDHADIIKKFI